MILNKYCKQAGCTQYMEWVYFPHGSEQSHLCSSCKSQGQQFNITKLSKYCQFKKEIVGMIKNETSKP